jgi:hypothetical protein
MRETRGGKRDKLRRIEKAEAHFLGRREIE